MAVQKNFVVKNGIEVNTDLIFADKDLNKVGIGTTIVNDKLQVKGGVSAESLNVSGIGTVSYLNGTNLNFSGIGTIDGVKINSGIVTSSSGSPITYYGDGSKLTGILTSVIVKSAGSYIGLVTAIDISTNLSVIVSPSGIATITASGGPNYLYTLRTGITTTATLGQTGFTTSYSVGYVDVFINGVKLDESEYTATDGTNITLDNPCFGGESVSIVSYGSNPLGPSAGTLWFQNLYGMYSLSGLSVGIGTSVPTENLTVIGNASVSSQFSIGTSIVFSGIGSTAYIGSGVTINGGSGEIYARTFYGNGSGITSIGYATTAGIATYATSSGISTYSTTAGIATYSTSSGVSTSTIGGISSVTQLQVSGISTFTSGPVLIGSGTSTGTSGQILQVVGVNSSAYIGGNLGIGSTTPTSPLTVLNDSKFGGIIENVATATTYLSGTALVLELDVRRSTYYTYTIPTGANVGIISFRNMPAPTGSPSASTVTCIFTQNAAGTGNTTNATGIGTNITIVGYENGSSVTGISTRAFVGSGTTVTLSTRGVDVDFVSFFIQYTGGSNISTSSYRVYATKNGSFR